MPTRKTVKAAPAAKAVSNKTAAGKAAGARPASTQPATAAPVTRSTEKAIKKAGRGTAPTKTTSARRAGVLAVVACGNEGLLRVQTPDGDAEISTPMSIGDPANLEDCIAVGSVNADRPYLYGISSFSSRGPTADGRLKPDVVAPGERIRSANAHFADGELYFEESGTSMAAPHVSGLLAAFLSVRREFRGRPDEVKALLLKTCNDTGRDRYHQGHGVPNLMQMLLAS